MQCCVFTRGEVFIRDAVNDCVNGIMDIICEPGPFKKIGNVSSLVMTIDGSAIGKENEFNPADPSSRMEILGVNLSIAMSCISSENLRTALLSEKTEPDSGTYIDSVILCNDIESGDFVPFTHSGATNVEVFLLNEVETPLVEDTDYTVEKSGIRFISSIARGSNTELRVRYDYSTTAEDFEFFSEAPKYKELFFKGINFGESEEKTFDARFYRVLFSPWNENDLLTKDGMMSISLSGSVERVGGKWFKITKE